MRAPDFIIIGAMKSATSTVYEQLRLQSGIFLPELKEPNFFSDDEQYKKGFAWYFNLFNPAAPNDLIGEASTHYTKVPTYPATVDRMAEVLEEPKLIYIMRHPIERLVSHYMHEWSEDKIIGSIDEAIDEYPRLVDYSQYARQLAPYIERFGYQAILPVFFERLKAEPIDTLHNICDFIGYRNQPVWHADRSIANAATQRIHNFRGKELLIEGNAAKWIRRHFVPKALRERIRKSLTINSRPTLSPSKRQALEVRFNKDLKQLGSWLGVELSCQNFAMITTSNQLRWSDPFVVNNVMKK